MIFKNSLFILLSALMILSCGEENSTSNTNGMDQNQGPSGNSGKKQENPGLKNQTDPGKTKTKEKPKAKSCNLMAPFRNSDPAQVLPAVSHPQKPLRNSLKGPIPTNHFMGNWLLAPAKDPIYIHPYVLKLHSQWPYGLSISHNHKKVSGGKGSGGAVQFYFNPFNIDMAFASTEKLELPQIESFDEFSFKAKLKASNGTGSISFPLVRGMAYVTAIYHDLKPIIFSGHSILKVNGQGIRNGNTYQGKSFK